MDGLVGIAEDGEATAELRCSVAEPGCFAAADRRTCASDDGEPVPA
jgi:hypothetical protein